MNIYDRHQTSKTCVANKFMNNSPYLLKVSFHITLTVFYVIYTTLEDNSRNIVDRCITRKTVCFHYSSIGSNRHFQLLLYLEFPTCIFLAAYAWMLKCHS